MNKKLEEELFEKYPNIFRGRTEPLTSNLMGYGFSCGDGWFKLISHMLEKINLVQSLTGIDVKALQCKEKFGGLRFYYSTSNGEDATLPQEALTIGCDIIEDIVRKAESTAYRTCEICGDNGRNECINGWYTTVCSKHLKKGE